MALQSSEFFVADFPSVDNSPQTSYPSTQQNNNKVFNQGRKRKIPREPQHMPNKLPYLQHVQQFFCGMCKVQLNSLIQAEQHKRGRSHQLKEQMKQSSTGAMNSMMELREQHSGSLELSPGSTTVILPKVKDLPLESVSLDCVICSKKFNSKRQAEQHFNGQSHCRKLKVLCPTGEDTKKELTVSHSSETVIVPQEQPEQALLGNTTASETASSEHAGTSELYCEFCFLTLNSKSQMDMHLNGKMHKKFVARVALLPTVGESDPVMMFYCGECIMSFNSRSQLVLHKNSPNHFNRVQRQQACGQSSGTMRGRGRGRGRGQGRGRGGTSFRGRQKNRGRGGAAAVSKFPPLSSSFVKANSNWTNPFNKNDPFFQQTQLAYYETNLTGQNPSLLQPFV